MVGVVVGVVVVVVVVIVVVIDGTKMTCGIFFKSSSVVDRRLLWR
jgi:hypothetical protein